MPRTIEGSLVATGLKFAVVVGRWNSFIAERMLEGSLDTINRHGGDTDAVDIVRVPGSSQTQAATMRLSVSGC
jgi:6,7-dimethyl-8-ribityllumazine synthase